MTSDVRQEFTSTQLSDVYCPESSLFVSLVHVVGRIFNHTIRYGGRVRALYLEFITAIASITRSSLRMMERIRQKLRYCHKVASLRINPMCALPEPYAPPDESHAATVCSTLTLGGPVYGD